MARKEYIKTYLNYFGYSEGDYIPSEISGSPAVDIHHIEHNGTRKHNIENLIALTREEHIKAHNYELKKEYLKKIHNKFMKKYETRIH